jgi:hypothetical protein
LEVVRSRNNRRFGPCDRRANSLAKTYRTSAFASGMKCMLVKLSRPAQGIPGARAT